MKRFYLIGFAILLLFDTAAQTSFKLAAVDSGVASVSIDWLVRLLSEQWVYLGLLAYLGAFATYMTLLRHAPIGPAFAATHMEVVTVLLVSVFFLGEKMTAVQVAGSLLIIGGILLLGMEPEPSVENQMGCGNL